MEEQFYLFWPILNRACGRRTLATIALATLPIGSASVLVLGYCGASANIGIWTNSLVEFQFFGYGVLLSLLLNGRPPRISPCVRILLFCSGLMLWFSAARWTGINSFGQQSVFGPVAGYYLVGLGCISIFLSAYGVAQRWVPQWMVYLGKISYGLYVFHEFSLEIAGSLVQRLQRSLGSSNHVFFGVGHLLLGLVIAVGFAVLSYQIFESPFLRFKACFAVIQSRDV